MLAMPQDAIIDIIVIIAGRRISAQGEIGRPVENLSINILGVAPKKFPKSS
jgi:hypothetical protein